MVFGPIKRAFCREWRRDALSGVFFAIAVHVDVKSFLGNIVTVFSTTAVVVVSNDRLPVAVVVIFELYHEPSHLVRVSVEADTGSDRSVERSGEFTIIRARRHRLATTADRTAVRSNHPTPQDAAYSGIKFRPADCSTRPVVRYSP